MREHKYEQSLPVEDQLELARKTALIDRQTISGQLAMITVLERRIETLEYRLNVLEDWSMK